MAKKPEFRPWHPAPYEEADVAAVQALMRGDATQEQQKRSLIWIIETAAKTYDMSYISESDRDTAFAEGKEIRWKSDS